MTTIDLSAIITQYNDCLNNPQKLRAVLLDMYPAAQERKYIKVIIAIMDSCGGEAPSSTVELSLVASQIEDEYGYSHELVRECADLWKSALGFTKSIQGGVAATQLNKSTSGKGKRISPVDSENPIESIAKGSIGDDPAKEQRNRARYHLGHKRIKLSKWFLALLAITLVVIYDAYHFIRAYTQIKSEEYTAAYANLWKQIVPFPKSDALKAVAKDHAAFVLYQQSDGVYVSSIDGIFKKRIVKQKFSYDFLVYHNGLLYYHDYYGKAGAVYAVSLDSYKVTTVLSDVYSLYLGKSSGKLFAEKIINHPGYVKNFEVTRDYNSYEWYEINKYYAVYMGTAFQGSFEQPEHRRLAPFPSEVSVEKYKIIHSPSHNIEVENTDTGEAYTLAQEAYLIGAYSGSNS